jgi:hypothetical protein
MYFSKIYSIFFFLDSFFHFLYLFKTWEIFMPHPAFPWRWTCTQRQIYLYFHMQLQLSGRQVSLSVTHIYAVLTPLSFSKGKSRHMENTIPRVLSASWPNLAGRYEHYAIICLPNAIPSFILSVITYRRRANLWGGKNAMPPTLWACRDTQQ